MIHSGLVLKFAILFRDVDCMRIAGDMNLCWVNTHRNKQSILPQISLHFPNLPRELNNHCIFQVVLKFGGNIVTDTHKNIMFILMCIA